MTRKIFFSITLAAALFLFATPAWASITLSLHDGWTLQSSAKISARGDTISQSGYRTAGWLHTEVPATILAAQVASGSQPCPFFGTNLRSIPGTTYPLGEDFSPLPMPPDSPYRVNWWYRTEFQVPPTEDGQVVWLLFKGINYRANIWLNGQRIADASQVAGTYRTYEFNVTDQLSPGKTNVLAVETIPPTEKDLDVHWVDWNPCPPDKNMGLWGGVDLVTTGPVTLRSPLVTTHFVDSSLGKADLTVYCEVNNASDQPVQGTLSGTVAGIQIQQDVALAPHEGKTVTFDPATEKALRIDKPTPWWPWQMGSPHLETLTLQFIRNGTVSDRQSAQFGIREITSELTDKGYRLFHVNGRPILIRGAGWSPDMLLRENTFRLRQQFQLVRDMGLNTIRLEGKMETNDFFHLADEQGILILLGWCCGAHWEDWPTWTPEDHDIAKASLQSQMLRLRSHPSLLAWLNGSDIPPPADVEKMYLGVESETHWPNPILSSASGAVTTISGASGVKMTGPYDYVAPSYWSADKGQHGGAFGFNTETSPGAAIPNLASLRKFLPDDQIWPVTTPAWLFHNGGHDFKQLTAFNDAMNATYSTPKNLENYVRVAQTMAYDGERAMFEAYSANKYTSTGVIQWMLNNAWPSNIWHLYDYYLNAGGGYYGTKKACEPLHVQYAYDDHEVVVVNSTYVRSAPLTVSVRVYDLQLNQVFSEEGPVTVNADSVQHSLSIPDSIFATSARTLLIDLRLKTELGHTVSQNFYWVPAVLTKFDWDKTNYTRTPSLKPEVMTDLLGLPRAELRASAATGVPSGGDQFLNSLATPTSASQVLKKVVVQIVNPSKALAFQVEVDLRDAHGQEISPAPWSDNYIELLPGESRVVTTIAPAKLTTGGSVAVSGWNVTPKTLTLP